MGLPHKQIMERDFSTADASSDCRGSVPLGSVLGIRITDIGTAQVGVYLLSAKSRLRLSNVDGTAGLFGSARWMCIPTVQLYPPPPSLRKQRSGR